MRDYRLVTAGRDRTRGGGVVLGERRHLLVA
jgi:hypothetical protein